MTVKPALLVLGLSFLLACAGDDPVAPPLHLEDLVGTWTLTSWQYTSVDDPTDHVDWVATFSLTGSLSVTSGGAFTADPGLPGGYHPDFGSLTLAADSIYWDGEDDEQWVGATLDDPILTLDWREVEYMSLHRDGEPRDVRLVVTFRRD